MTGAAPPGLLVDSHAHIFRRDLPMPPEAVFAPRNDFEIDAYEAILDRAGVTFAVIAAPRFLGTYNDYTLRQIRGRPRFKATVILDPATDPYVLKAMHADGAIGVRLSLRDARQLPDLASYEYTLFFRRLADLGWHVHLHLDGQRLPLVLPALQAAPMPLRLLRLTYWPRSVEANTSQFGAPARRSWLSFWYTTWPVARTTLTVMPG